MRTLVIATVAAAVLAAGCLAGDAGDASLPAPTRGAPPAPDAAPAPAPPAGGRDEPSASGEAPPANRTLGPYWEFTDTTGGTHSRDSSLDRPVVLFFMASWCSSCRATTPALARVNADYADEGVRFYSLSFDASDDAESLDAWKARHAQPWPHGVDPGFGTQRTFGVTAQSSVVVLDADGLVAARWGYGRVTEPALREALDAALREGS